MSHGEAQFELVFEGPSDGSPETLRRLKGVFIADLEFSIEDTVNALQKFPLTIKVGESENSLSRYYNAIQNAGGKVLLVKPAGALSSETSPATVELGGENFWQAQIAEASQQADVEEDSPFSFEFEIDQSDIEGSAQANARTATRQSPKHVFEVNEDLNLTAALEEAENATKKQKRTKRVAKSTEAQSHAAESPVCPTATTDIKAAEISAPEVLPTEVAAPQTIPIETQNTEIPLESSAATPHTLEVVSAKPKESEEPKPTATVSTVLTVPPEPTTAPLELEFSFDEPAPSHTNIHAPSTGAAVAKVEEATNAHDFLLSQLTLDENLLGDAPLKDSASTKSPDEVAPLAPSLFEFASSESTVGIFDSTEPGQTQVVSPNRHTESEEDEEDGAALDLTSAGSPNDDIIPSAPHLSREETDETLQDEKAVDASQDFNMEFAEDTEVKAPADPEQVMAYQPSADLMQLEREGMNIEALSEGESVPAAVAPRVPVKVSAEYIIETPVIIPRSNFPTDLVLWIVGGALFLMGFNWWWFNFSPQEIAPEMEESITSDPSSAPKPNASAAAAHGHTVMGSEQSYSTTTLLGTMPMTVQLVSTKDAISSLKVSIIPPEPAHLTREEIVEHKLRDPWAKKIEGDTFQFLKNHNNEFEGAASTRIIIEDQGAKSVVQPLSVAGHWDAATHHLSLQVWLGEGKFKPDDTGFSISRAEKSDYLVTLSGALETDMTSVDLKPIPK